MTVRLVRVVCFTILGLAELASVILQLFEKRSIYVWITGVIIFLIYQNMHWISQVRIQSDICGAMNLYGIVSFIWIVSYGTSAHGLFAGIAVSLNFYIALKKGGDV